MIRKDFTKKLDNDQDKKKVQNLTSENTRLRDKITELTNVLNQQDNDSEKIEINISDIKIATNIRKVLSNINALAKSINDDGQLQPGLLTSDGYMIDGYRRLEAKKILGHKTILVCYYDKPYERIKHYLPRLQFEVNQQRESLDNFDISNVFQEYIDNNYNQKDIALIFKKTKGYVSSLLKLQNILPELVRYFKEFQEYAYSEKKFIAMNSDQIDEDKFYAKNKGVIGWLSLYKIASKKTELEQKKAFLKEYGDRLTEEEYNSPFFTEALEIIEITQITPKKQVYKVFHNMFKTIQSSVTPEVRASEEYQKIQEIIAELEEALEKIEYKENLED